MAVKTVTIGELKAELARLWKLFPEGEPVGEDCDNDLYAEYEKMRELRQLEADLSHCWEEDNAYLIRSGDFTEYGMELLYEMGDVRKGGICDQHLDYDKVTESLEQDYRLVTYDNEDYWIRN